MNSKKTNEKDAKKIEESKQIKSLMQSFGRATITDDRVYCIKKQ